MRSSVPLRLFFSYCSQHLRKIILFLVFLVFTNSIMLHRYTEVLTPIEFFFIIVSLVLLCICFLFDGCSRSYGAIHNF